MGIALFATGQYALGLDGDEEGGCLDPDAARDFLRRIEALPRGDCAGARCEGAPHLPRQIRETRRVGGAWRVGYRTDARAYLDAREQLVTRSPTDAERVCRLMHDGSEPPVVTYVLDHSPGSMIPWRVSGCVRGDGWFLHEHSGGHDEGRVQVGRYEPVQVAQAASWLRARGWDHTRNHSQGGLVEPLCRDGRCFDPERGLVFGGSPLPELE